jgi:sodium/bile acid cotransporter 7
LPGKAEQRKAAAGDKAAPAVGGGSFDRRSNSSSLHSGSSSSLQSKKQAAGSVVGRGPCAHVRDLARALLKHWFLVGTACSIVAAQVYPWLGSDAGPLKPQVTVKYGAVVLIFFVSGVTMKTETMVDTIRDWRLHAFIQAFALGLVPALVIGLVLPLLRAMGLPAGLVEGFRVVGCMPPPVSTSVILTKAAGGNEAAAVFNSALGSFLGVVVTPVLLLLLVDPTAGGALNSSAANAVGADGRAGGSESSARLLGEIFVELGVTVRA